jgi:hypothetical protein
VGEDGGDDGAALVAGRAEDDEGFFVRRHGACGLEVGRLGTYRCSLPGMLRFSPKTHGKDDRDIYMCLPSSSSRMWVLLSGSPRPPPSPSCRAELACDPWLTNISNGSCKIVADIRGASSIQ